MSRCEMTRQKECPLCRFQAELKLRNHPGYQEPHQYAIYHCRGCEAAFCDPLEIDTLVYNHIYRQVDQMPGYNRYFHYAQKVLQVDDPLMYLSETEDVYWSIKTALEQRNHKEIDILEVGCGFGYLTYALHQSGYRVKGIDISQVAIDHASNRYGPYFECIDLNALALDPAAPQYDVIISTEVIEHIQDIKNFLASASKLLKKHGQLILTTPNRSAYSPDVLWETECPPVHLFWLSEKTMSKLAEELNMQIRFIDMTPFSLQEIERGNACTMPPFVERLHPTRKPTLDSAGMIIPHQMPPPKDFTVIRTESRLRQGVKKSLNAAGLLQPIAKQKATVLHQWNLFKTFLKKLRQRIYVKIIRPKRTPLCAVMTKMH